MKNFFVGLLTLLLASAASAAVAGPFGLGVILGSPTGISGRYNLSQESAIDGALAWSLIESRSMQIHGDYLLQMNNVFHTARPIDFYYGIGGRFLTYKSDRRASDDLYRLGVRAPIGLATYFPKPSLQVFLEVALVLNLIARTDLDLDAAVGVRYFFK